MSRAAAATAGAGSVSAGGASRSSAKSLRGYLPCSELPLTSLVFLLPLIVLYEIGTWQFASDPVRHTEQRIIAFTILKQFFGLFGATGKYLPAMAVVGILLAWHIARRDAWRIQLPHLAGMALESALLSVPLICFGFVVARYLPLWSTAQPHPLPSLIVLSIGAGIYEELVFRLIAFTVLSLLFIDVLGMRKGWASVLMVVGSSLLFSFYHYLGHEPFKLQSFAFRTGAGLYFGAVFVFRGFGITAGSHAAYDMLVVLLRSAV